MTAADRQRQNIIAATFSLVESRGLAALSLSDIAKEAGVSRQTVYNHFPDTGAVFEAALDMHGNAMVAHVDALMAEAEGARAKLVTLAEFMVTSADPAHETLPLEAGLSPDARARLARHNEALRRRIAEVLGPDTGDAGRAARGDMVWTLIEATSHTAARHPDDKPRLLAILIAAIDAAL